MELSKAFDSKVFEKALRRTVKRMGTRFRKTAVKEVRQTYNVRAKKLKEYIKARTHYGKGGVEWRFRVSGKPMSLIHFSPRQTRQGVTVKVKKSEGRKMIKGAFLANDSGSHKRVFMRSGKARLPIESKHTISIPQMFNKEILKKAQKEVEENYEKEFKHNLDFYMGRLK